jgi:hypothetical protein
VEGRAMRAAAVGLARQRKPQRDAARRVRRARD